MTNVHSDDEGDTPFAISEDLAQLPSYKEASTSLVTFDGLLAQPLHLHEDLAKGCGGQLWPAGVRLAKYLLLRKRDELSSRTMYGKNFFLHASILRSPAHIYAVRMHTDCMH